MYAFISILQNAFKFVNYKFKACAQARFCSSAEKRQNKVKRKSSENHQKSRNALAITPGFPTKELAKKLVPFVATVTPQDVKICVTKVCENNSVQQTNLCSVNTESATTYQEDPSTQ